VFAQQIRGNDMTDRYEHRAFDNGAERSLERICLALGFVAGMAFTIGATAALATPWTDESGNPNPACLSQHCHETGIPDTAHEPHGNSAEPPLPETHNGFSCAHKIWWVYHPAARPRMTKAHDAAAKAEALDRLARLGDKAADKVCRPWQIAAGFKIAGVMTPEQIAALGEAQ
jgi:hypothetical protein